MFFFFFFFWGGKLQLNHLQFGRNLNSLIHSDSTHVISDLSIPNAFLLLLCEALFPSYTVIQHQPFSSVLLQSSSLLPPPVSLRSSFFLISSCHKSMLLKFLALSSDLLYQFLSFFLFLFFFTSDPCQNFRSENQISLMSYGRTSLRFERFFRSDLSSSDSLIFSICPVFMYKKSL